MATESQTFTSQRFRKLFLAEAADLIASMERDLLRLQDDFPPDEAVKSAFRTAHTLKGNAAMTGYSAAADFIHALETIFQELNARTRQLTPDLLQTLLEATDCIREILDGAPNDPIPPRADDFRTILCIPQASIPDQRKSPSEPQQTQTYRITWSPAVDSLARGADPIRTFSALKSKATILHIRTDWKVIPPLRNLDPERCYLTWQTTLSTNQTTSTLRDWFQLMGPQQRLTIERNHDNAEPPKPPQRTAESTTDTAYLRVPRRKLDNLLNMVTKILQDQHHAKSIATGHAAFTVELLRLLERLERNTSLIQREMQNLGRVELNEIFRRLPRLVHDLSIQLGKQIRVKIDGGEFQVDRSHAEHLSNALGHLIRNCVDHGIEMPPDRLAAGKPIHGLITIKAHLQPSQTIIEVSDDGRGIQYGRIYERAVAMGILEDYWPIEPSRLTELIFQPGLSTADGITRNSGRGVGMDAVRSALQSIQASIEVSSEPNRGSTFRITLPTAPTPPIAK